jgi:hypothetical protein
MKYNKLEIAMKSKNKPCPRSTSTNEVDEVLLLSGINYLFPVSFSTVI